MIVRVETLLRTASAIALVFVAGCSGENDYQERAAPEVSREHAECSEPDAGAEKAALSSTGKSKT